MTTAQPASGTARPSVRDVAVRAGVSVGTVSHVLNHPDRVAEATRERVEAAITELGFVRSEAARRLRAGSSSLVGVVVLDISNPFFTEAARGIEDRLRADGCVPMLCSSDGDAARELEIMQILAGQDVRGVIVTPGPSTLENLPVLTSRGIRVVLMDHPALAEGLSTVVADDVAGARAAVAHLLGLGHRRIGFINGPSRVRQARDRRTGVLQALAEAGLDPAEVLVEVEGLTGGVGFSADAGAVGAAQVLDSADMGQDEGAGRRLGAGGSRGTGRSGPAGTRPTALFCANDQLAIGAMREVRARGLAIPEDVAIVGYDDISVAAELITPLTSVRQPMRELGVTAADLLLTPEAGVQHITFTPELVVRDSTVGRAPSE